MTPPAERDGATVRRRFPYGYRRLHADPNIESQLNRFLDAEPEAELRALAARIVDHATWKREMLGAAARLEASGARRGGPIQPRRGVLPDPRRSREARCLRAVHAPVLARARGRARRACRGPLRDRRSRRSCCAPRRATPSWCTRASTRTSLRCSRSARRSATPGSTWCSSTGPARARRCVEHGLPMTHAGERPVGAVLDHLGLRDLTPRRRVARRLPRAAPSRPARRPTAAIDRHDLRGGARARPHSAPRSARVWRRSAT